MHKMGDFELSSFKFEIAQMDWNDLKIFYTVAEQRNLTTAADVLGMSHTTVFRRLKAFESSIGSRLFDRIQGRYELTETGLRLLGKVRIMSGIAEDAAREIVGDDRTPGGDVIVTAPSSFAQHFLPSYLLELSTLYPDIAVTLLVTNDELNMSTRQADVALRVAKSPPDHLVGRKLMSIRWGMYGAPSYFERLGKPESSQDLAGHTFIGASGRLTTLEGYTWLERQNDLLSRTHTDDLTTMSSLAAAGHGLALLPDDLSRDDLERCFTLELAGKNSLWILTHPDLRRVERINIVMRFLGEKFKTEPRLHQRGCD
ncbi:LysR family transcriptional regulator [Parasedimentitalea maritima]|uniref:LysR family transcriptional regulator n=1 Tax=Parasedimentitalea maritima TaxID=2578117 RepID=A0A6A4RB39_9RHOB|nr:LysR family transcriptional regulator [Zongyanglinia marina]KAE9630378.1 LysR family transcriptional regulator [Zongyanglinia marina]